MAILEWWASGYHMTVRNYDGVSTRLDTTLSEPGRVAPTPGRCFAGYTGFRWGKRFTYKLAVLTHKVRTTATPTYLGELVHRTDPRTTSGSELFRYSDTRRSSHTHRTGPSRFSVAAPSTWNSLPADIPLYENILTFQMPLENPSVQTHLVLLCCIKLLCIFGPKGAIQIRYLSNLTFFNLPRPAATATAATAATA